MIGPPDHLPGTPAMERRAPMDPQDPLSDLLRTMRLTGGVFLEAEFTAPWCVLAQVAPEDCRPLPAPAQLIAYHYVLAGRLQLQAEGEPPVALEAGEIVLLPRNDPHRLGSALDIRPVDAGQLIQPAADGGGPARIVFGGNGEAARILCGFLGSDVRGNPLLASLPRVLRFRVGEGASGDWIASSFRFAAQELRGGSATMLARLAELLFLEAVRRYLDGMPPGRIGWLPGLRDPVVGRALALMHGRAAHPWTTEELAREAGLSRSAFAERFTALLGEPPMRYLGRWRIRAAADRLRDGQPVARAAYEVGYASEAAFSRAFKREFGVPPAAWREEGGGP
jgi:AraC-like DNA-binding protein